MPLGCWELFSRECALVVKFVPVKNSFMSPYIWQRNILWKNTEQKILELPENSGKIAIRPKEDLHVWPWLSLEFDYFSYFSFVNSSYMKFSKVYFPFFRRTHLKACGLTLMILNSLVEWQKYRLIFQCVCLILVRVIQSFSSEISKIFVWVSFFKKTKSLKRRLHTKSFQHVKIKKNNYDFDWERK